MQAIREPRPRPCSLSIKPTLESLARIRASKRRGTCASAERERILGEFIGEEETRRASPEEIMKEHRVAFVVHSEEVAQTLETFAHEKDRLVKVIPSTRGSYAEEMGIKASWLVFDPSE